MPSSPSRSLRQSRSVILFGMHIAVVGAGALGSTYALRLARVARVTLVVREASRAPSRIRGEPAAGHAPPEVLEQPSWATEIPKDADVVLVAVRVDQLGDDLFAALAGGPSRRIVVIVTPLLPADYSRAKTHLGSRLIAAMPGVVAYEPEPSHGGEQRIRFWTPRAAPTLLDARPLADPNFRAVEALAETMTSAGLRCEIVANVPSQNAATTVAFFPLILGIEVCGTIDALLADPPLMRLGLESVRETRKLARSLGEVAGFVSLVLSFASPFTLRAGIKLARARSPESLVFIERHFGRKLRVQNATMLEQIQMLARERAIPTPALERPRVDGV